jgi:hypothetical protein
VIQRGKLQDVGNLFSDDAVFYSKWANSARKGAIGAFYSAFLSASTPTVRTVRFADDFIRRIYLMGLEIHMQQDDHGLWTNSVDGEYSLGAIDWLTVNADGRISDMIVYLAPRVLWKEQ